MSLTCLRKYPSIAAIMRRRVPKAVVMRRLLVSTGTLLLALAATGGWATAEETTSQAPLFAMDGYLQAKSVVATDPWGDPLEGVDGYVTRGRLAIVLAESLGLEDSTESYYSDVQDTEECFGAVGALHEARLLNGQVSPEFSPESVISRQQALAWTVDALSYRLSQDPESTVPIRFSFYESADLWLGEFRDRDLISNVLKRSVANAYRLGLVEASGDGHLYPTMPLSEEDLDGLLRHAFSGDVVAKATPPETVDVGLDYATVRLESEGCLVRYLEYQLAALKYRPGPIDGVFDVRTRDAVYAFQKVEGLRSDGIVGARVWDSLLTAETPRPELEKPGTRAEVDLGRQVMFMIRDNQVCKIVHISSGKPQTATLTGHFEVDRKIPGWVGDSYGTTMYFTSFFDMNHSLAIHGYAKVPTYAASHGCVRVPIWMAEELYEELPAGTPVDIYKS